MGRHVSMPVDGKIFEGFFLFYDIYFVDLTGYMLVLKHFSC